MNAPLFGQLNVSTFPVLFQQLMAMMRYAEEQGDDFCVKWLEDGKSFIIDDPDTFTKKVVPQYFKPTKFSSFTRKLYRWGFRQINRGMGQDDPVIFGSDFFQRNKPELMAKMKSTTAAATRKAEEEVAMPNSQPRLAGMKRPAEVEHIELQQQRLLSHLLRKTASYENATTAGHPSLQPPYPQQATMGNRLRPMISNDLSLSKIMYPGPSFSLGTASPHLMTTPHRSSICDSSLIGQFNPSTNYIHQNMIGAGPSSMRMPGMQTNFVRSPPPPPSSQLYPMASPASTAEIVHAAIQALKYA